MSANRIRDKVSSKCHTVPLDPYLSSQLLRRSLALSARKGYRVYMADLLRTAWREYITRHPDTEVFEDAKPELKEL